MELIHGNTRRGDKERVVVFRQRQSDWKLHCPHCTHTVLARSEQEMDRGIEMHGEARHRPQPSGDAA